MRKTLARLLLILLPVALFALAHADRAERMAPGNWRNASREAVGLAPDPATVAEAVVQVYAARAVNWRGYLGVHTWIAAKPTDAAEFTVYEVLSWGLRRRGTTVRVSNRIPDSRWYGNAPELLADLRGEGVDEVIARIDGAVGDYPYTGEYRVWPGPNSNTFTAFVLRAAPEVRADLPANAIGKDYLGPSVFARSPSGTGLQFNVLGVLGVLVGVEEGLELNVLGLTFGLDPNQLSLKLPLAGRLGFGAGDVARALEPLTDETP